MALTFKFTKPGGLTRRVTFPTRPTWSELAVKIQLLYLIPFERIGVSYHDADGDEVTLSTQEELEDYYNSPALSDTIRLNVIDLSVSRDDDKGLPPTPTESRGTFGGPTPLIYEVEEDWQIPFGVPFGATDPLDRSASLHAYLETVDSSSVSSRRQEDAASSTRNGKGKARDFGSLHVAGSGNGSSTTSIIDNDTPTKPPIHIPVHTAHSIHSDTFGPPLVTSTPVHGVSPPTSAAPRTAADYSRSPLDSVHGPVDENQPFLPLEIPDPPTPDFHAEQLPNPAASLSDDVASLLNSVSAAFTAHPELTEGLRKILRNMHNGAYWAIHRESVARAAEDIRRASIEIQNNAVSAVQDVRRAAEEESGRRVTEAIANVLRVFGEVTDNPTTGEANPTPAFEQPETATGAQVPETTNPPVHEGFEPDVAPNQSHMHPLQASRSLPIGSANVGQPQFVPPWSHFKPFVPATFGATGAMQPMGDPNIMSSHPPDVSFYAASPTSPDAAPRSRPRASELKSSLEAAKENYKREKARYRQERDQRRRMRAEREQAGATEDTPGSSPVNVQPVADKHVSVSPPRPPRQIISNARGNFPQMEIVGLSSPKSLKRSNSLNAASPSRVRPPVQAMRNIVEKLEDMGFNETTHPNLPMKIDAHLPANIEITKDKEDDVVSEVVDDLLSDASPTPAPQASGSGHRNVALWH